MSPAQLERYLHEHIPLSREMQVSVIEVGAEEVVLGAPLAPNINHRETVFGGSACAIAILAAWALLHARLGDAGIGGRLVIQRNSMNYRLPIQGDFTVRSSVSADAWQKFLRMLSRKGIARITVSATLEYMGQAVGDFEGEFVALSAKTPGRTDPADDGD
jgi:thioesterase domain-containing protein